MIIQNNKRLLFINFTAEINQNTSEALMWFISQKLNEGIKEFYILLSSPGGNVNNGITIYNFLRSIPAKVITHNIGMIDSIANLVFLAGEERYAVPNSSFLFHGVGFNIPQPKRFEEKELKEMLIGIERDQNLISQIIAERTNLKQDEIKKMFYEAVTMDPKKSKEVGIIHDIKLINIPEGVEIASFSFFQQRPWS